MTNKATIVEYDHSVVQNIDVAVAQGCEHLVFVVGGRGEHLARRFISLPDIGVVQIGNFFGLALAQASQAGAQKVTLAGMIGKLSKFAAGHASVVVKPADSPAPSSNVRWPSRSGY